MYPLERGGPELSNLSGFLACAPLQPGGGSETSAFAPWVPGQIVLFCLVLVAPGSAVCEQQLFQKPPSPGGFD